MLQLNTTNKTSVAVKKCLICQENNSSLTVAECFTGVTLRPVTDIRIPNLELSHISIRMKNMDITTIIGLLVLGLFAGGISSLVGIGGGVLIVPALVFLFSASQKTAQGTSLAMLLPPIGLLAVINYHKAGFVDYKIAAILCISFVAGTYFGSKFALGLPDSIIKKIFAVFLMLVAARYLFFDK